MANTNIPIIRLKESDIISQSMNIINQNFDTIVNNYDIANFKWEQYSKKITDEIEKVKNYCKNSNIDIARTVDSLNTRIDNITDLNDIQTQINNAIMNANLELTGFISDLAGQQVANAMGGYVKTSALDNKLKGYVASSAFETYKSDAKNSTASSSLIVANSKFATVKYNNKDYLINNDADGSRSQYQTIEEYWENEVKNTYPDLSDADTLNSFIGNCETKFRTVSTELANISTKVGPGSSQVDILAEVTNPTTGVPITAAIFAQANQNSSSIKLYADNITLTSNHKLELLTDQFTIDSTNLKVDTSGNVTVNGDIYAKSLHTIGDKTQITSDGTLIAQNAQISGDITANRFLSNISTTQETIGSDTWTFGRQSVMNADEFRVTSSRKQGNTEKDPSHIYITVLPEYTVDSGDPLYDETDNTGKLIGVPVLCFEYNGHPYYLTPNAWKSATPSGGNDTNMYWGPAGTVYTRFEYIGDRSSNQSYRVKKTVSGGNCYIFKPGNSNNNVEYSSTTIYGFYYSLGTIQGQDLTDAQGWLSSNGLSQNNGVVCTISNNASSYGSSIGSRRQITQGMCQTFGGMKYSGSVFSTLSTPDRASVTTFTALSSIANTLSLNPGLVSYIGSNYMFGSDNPWDTYIDCYDSYTGTNYGGDFLQFLNSAYTEIANGTRKCKAARRIEYSWEDSYTNGIKTNTTTSNIYAKCTYGIIVDFSDKTATNIGGNREIYNVTDAEIIVQFNVYFNFSGNPVNTLAVLSTINNILSNNSTAFDDSDLRNHTRFGGIVYGTLTNGGTTGGDEPIAVFGDYSFADDIFAEIENDEVH